MAHIIWLIIYELFLGLFRLDDDAPDIMKVSRAKIYNQLDDIETEISECFMNNIEKFIEQRSGGFSKRCFYRALWMAQIAIYFASFWKSFKVSISFDHYALKHNVRLLGIVCHINTDSDRACMFLGLKRVVSEDYKTTKLHILDICRKFNIFNSIQKVAFVADGALWSCVANKLSSIKDDIEIPISNRCISHGFHRATQEWCQINLFISMVKWCASSQCSPF